MPYFVSNEQDDCAGWATIKIDADGTIETIGCHEEMNDAVAQMIAVSLDEGMDPGGEYNGATRIGDVQTMKRAELANIREVRQYGISDIEVRDDYEDETKITFRGYASVFNHDYEVHDAFGSFTERIAPGAFTRTLADNPDVMLLVNHQGLPLARTKSSTLRLTQDKVGLRVEAQLDGNDPDVRALMPKMRRGDLDEMSFAFRVNDQVWADDFTDRTITEVNLSRGDVSVVSFGANPATVAALRAALADEDVRAQLFAELEGRVLTTSDVDPAEPEVEAEAEPVVEVVEAEVVEADVAELVDVEVDEVRQQGSAHPMSYYQNLLVDSRLSA